MHRLFDSDASHCFICYTFGIGMIVLLQLLGVAAVQFEWLLYCRHMGRQGHELPRHSMMSTSLIIRP